MSWFQSGNIASFAKNKLKEVQQSIDKALDIKDEVGGSAGSTTVASVTEAATDFFASWGVGVKGVLQEESPEAEDETRLTTPTVMTSQPSTSSHANAGVGSEDATTTGDIGEVEKIETPNKESPAPMMRRSLTSEIPVELVAPLLETGDTKALHVHMPNDDEKFQSLWLDDSESFESSLEVASTGVCPNVNHSGEPQMNNLDESVDFRVSHPVQVPIPTRSSGSSPNPPKVSRSKKKRSRASSGGLPPPHTKHKESSGIAFSSEPSSTSHLNNLSEIELNIEDPRIVEQITTSEDSKLLLATDFRLSCEPTSTSGNVSEPSEDKSQDTSFSESTLKTVEAEDNSPDNTEQDLESSSATMVDPEPEPEPEPEPDDNATPENAAPLPNSNWKRSSSETSPEPPETDCERHSSKVSVSSRAPSSISIISEEKESSPQFLDSPSYEVMSFHQTPNSVRPLVHLPFSLDSGINSSANFDFIGSHHPGTSTGCTSHSSSICVIPSLHSTPDRGTPQTHSRSNSNTSSSFERIEDSRSNPLQKSPGQNFMSSTSSSDIEVIPLDSVELLPHFRRRILLPLHEVETQTEESWPSPPQQIIETKEKIVEMIPSKVASTLAEKDSEISQLREEGEKLSKKQFELSTAIKKLRLKEKETDSLVKNLKTELGAKNLEIERLLKSFVRKETLEQSQNDTIAKLNSEKRKLDDLVNELRSSLEDATENTASMKASLEDASVEILELQNSISSAQRDTAELDALTRDKGELTTRCERLQKEVDHLRLSINSTQSKASTREAELKGQISSLTQKVHILESQVSDVSSDIADATMPLSLEIDKLQQELKTKSNNWDRREAVLHTQISDLEQKLKGALEQEKWAREAQDSHQTSVENLESQLESVLEENSELKSKLKAVNEQNSINNEKLSMLSKFEAQVGTLSQQIESLKLGTETLTKELTTERNAVEAEKKRNQVLVEQLKVSQNNVQSSESFCKPDSRDNSPSSHSMASESSFLDDVLDGNVLGGHSTPKSFFDSFSSMNFIENMQGQLRQRELEVLTYQDEVSKTEKIRKTLNDEIAHLTVRNQELLQQMDHMTKLQHRLLEVEKNYNAVLQMYGEKVEEAEELRMDLQDVKEMYKVQIEQLLKKS